MFFLLSFDFERFNYFQVAMKASTLFCVLVLLTVNFTEALRDRSKVNEILKKHHKVLMVDDIDDLIVEMTSEEDEDEIELTTETQRSTIEQNFGRPSKQKKRSDQNKKADSNSPEIGSNQTSTKTYGNFSILLTNGTSSSDNSSSGSSESSSSLTVSSNNASLQNASSKNESISTSDSEISQNSSTSSS